MHFPKLDPVFEHIGNHRSDALVSFRQVFKQSNLDKATSTLNLGFHAILLFHTSFESSDHFEAISPIKDILALRTCKTKWPSLFHLLSIWIFRVGRKFKASFIEFSPYM